ncbi:PepSY domain-containing protein [Pseudomonas proteolytica]|nr:PepSY domain-containing protein [Pseudomonas proteolytica]
MGGKRKRQRRPRLLHATTGRAPGADALLRPVHRRLPGRRRRPGLFGLMLQLHRFLAIGDTGRQITGACTLILIFFCLSGLYLRWPRQVANWRAWLTLDWRKKGRSFNWDLHSVFGTWCLLFYLLAALTGLYWSYEWYSKGLTRLLSDAPQNERVRNRGPAPAGPAPVANYDAIWSSIYSTAGPDLSAYNIRMPPVAGQPATVFYLLQSSPP